MRNVRVGGLQVALDIGGTGGSMVNAFMDDLDDQSVETECRFASVACDGWVATLSPIHAQQVVPSNSNILLCVLPIAESILD